ncbi:MAG TPA: hypothetical protein VJ124_26080 [Pyrinomonadaceae bacterium]|nr:hypothetical protein [Pyrinomonadaceae bacterium]
MSSKANSLAFSGSARWVVIGIGVLAIVGLSVCLLFRAADNTVSSLNEAKKVRTTTAVVKAKEYVRFDEKNHSYVNNFGESVQVPPGSEQWRIYYQIDNFNQVPDPKRSQLWQSEETRIKKFGFRFYPPGTPDRTAYDKAQVGDQLEIRYRYMGDEKEIIGIRNLSHPSGG